MNRPWFELAQSKGYLQGDEVIPDIDTTKRKSASSESDEEDEEEDEQVPWVSFGPPPGLAKLAWQRIPMSNTGFLSQARKQSMDSTWAALDSKFTRVVQKANKKLFGQLVEFLDECEEQSKTGPFVSALLKTTTNKEAKAEEDQSQDEEEGDGSSDSGEDELESTHGPLDVRLSDREEDEGTIFEEKARPGKRVGDDNKSKKRRKVAKSERSTLSNRPRRKAAAAASLKRSGEARSQSSDEDSESDDDDEDDEGSGSSSESSSDDNGHVVDNDNESEEEGSLGQGPMEGDEANNEGFAEGDEGDQADDLSETYTPSTAFIRDEHDPVATGCQFIPTALVIGGQDTVDNEMLLTSLAKHLQTASARRKVVRLSSQQASSAKSLVDLLANSVTKKPGISAVDRVARWLRREEDAESNSGLARTLVVIVEDCEYFESINLKRLIRALKYIQWRCAGSGATLVLIMGISSVAGAHGLHGLLDRDDIRKLSISNFRPEDSIAVLDVLFYELFVRNPSQLRFSPRTLGWFHDRFRLDDFSLFAFRKHLKYAVMRHFESEPWSFLCCPPSRKSSSKSPEDWARTCIGRLSEAIAKQSVTVQNPEGDEDNVAQVTEMLLNVATELEQNRRDLPFVFRFVQLAGLRLGFLNKNQSLARNALSSDLLWSDETRVVLKSACLKVPLETILKLKDPAETILPASMQWRAREVFENIPLDQPSHSQTADLKRSSSITEIERPKDFHKWGAEKRKKWMQSAMIGPSSSAVVAQVTSDGIKGERGVRIKLMTFLEELIDHHLFRYMRRQLSSERTEVESGILCDRSKALEAAFSQTQGEILSEALLTPGTYISCQCCTPANEERDDYVPSMDDTVLAFKLFRSVGDVQQANLREWFEAFKDVVEEDEGDATSSKPKKKKKKADPILARFVRAACELQYLGLWKGDAQENARKLMDL